MEIKPTGKPAAPEPAEAPAAPAPAGPVKAKAHIAPIQDHLEVFVPPKLDLGHGELGHLPDPSDLGKLPPDLRSGLPAHFDLGPVSGHPPTPHPPDPGPPDPNPPPPDDLISKFRDPMIDRAAFSPEIGGTEQGPQGTPKKPAIRHGLGPGHFTTPQLGQKGPSGPDGFDLPGTPRPPDPRTSGLDAQGLGYAASSPIPPPEPAPVPPGPPNPPNPPQSVGFSGVIAAARRADVASYQDGDDSALRAGLAAEARGGATLQGETFGVQDPGPPTNPPDPGPPEPPPQPD